jgi:hypothetical protein
MIYNTSFSAFYKVSSIKKKNGLFFLYSAKTFAMYLD